MHEFPRRPRNALAPIVVVALSICFHAACQAAPLDLTHATVVSAPDASAQESKAVQMLLEEAAKRTGTSWRSTARCPDEGVPLIIVARVDQLGVLGGRFAEQIKANAPVAGAEGYLLRVVRDDVGTAVLVLGNDARGVLFGVGRLLRALHLSRGRAELDASLNVATAPAYPLRGHQLGYRPKTNSYDAWDLRQWEQYYRDLAVFGTNAVELLPPRTDDDADSPHFPLPPLEMMAGMSRLADDYGLDVWIWYPAMDRDYANPKTVEFALAEWAKVFQQLPRIDAVFVPGGDPGHTRPKHLLALLKKQTEVLHRTHPKAQMWVSPQSFNQAWLDEFVEILRQEKPQWLSGVVFGPQVRVSLPKLRELIPRQYPIRHYPDITHSRQCQYPVPDWDAAHSLTSGRECINPRPLGQATIFRLLQPHTIGFLTYSEGCNDDVNKAIWSGLGWNSDTLVIDILRDYAGYFIGDAYRDDFAQGLLALERNWRGPLVSNVEAETTLAQFQAMERSATPEVLANWRFQQALYRAYYDAYVRRRLLHESEAEAQALDGLRAATADNVLKSVDEAEAILDAVQPGTCAPDLRDRVVQLADALFQSIRMQTSVGRYQAIAVGRGATLDTLEYPLNNRHWLKQRFAGIRKLSDDEARLNAVRTIVDWTNPGPGGFYDDLGNAARQRHLLVGEGFERDPAFLASSHAGFAASDAPRNVTDPRPALRMSWIDHAESMVDAPLSLRYDDLDPEASYRVRVVYAGDGLEKKIRLEADDGVEVHALMTKPKPIAPIEFDIPSTATRDGALTLRWYREPGLGDNGRGCQVAEVWLMKRQTAGAASR